MYLLHYILPFLIFYFIKKDKVMLWGLLAGNLIDLDHVLARLSGEFAWFESACEAGLGSQCSFGLYALHNWNFAIALGITAIILFAFKRLKIHTKMNKISSWIRERVSLDLAMWLAIGALLNLILDYIHLLIGFGI